MPLLSPFGFSIYRYPSQTRYSLILRKCLFTDSRTKLELKLDTEPNNPEVAQQLFKLLAKKGQHKTLIQKFESSSRSIQQDGECVKSYIGALVKEGQVAKISELIGASSNSNRSARAPFSSQSTPTTFLDSPTLQQPIPVTLTEAFSWSKLLRKFGSKIITALVLLTGLSVILDQQGILKTNSVDIQSHSSLAPVKFSDVEGVDEAKGDLEEIVSFLKEPKKFADVGGRLPKGVLLHGPVCFTTYSAWDRKDASGSSCCR